MGKNICKSKWKIKFSHQHSVAMIEKWNEKYTTYIHNPNFSSFVFSSHNQDVN